MNKKLTNNANFKSPSFGGVGGGFLFLRDLWRLCLFFLLFLSIFSYSCRKPKPQLPSNKEVREESRTTVDLVRINKELIQKEDSLLSLFVLENDPDFKKTEAGFWYKKELITQNRLLKKEDVCLINYRLYSLDGTLLEEIDGFRVVVGKKEFIPGLDEALNLMRVGESTCFIFPWNLAFGMRGYKNLIPAYTSVIMKIEVLQQQKP